MALSNADAATWLDICKQVSQVKAQIDAGPARTAQLATQLAALPARLTQIQSQQAALKAKLIAEGASEADFTAAVA